MTVPSGVDVKVDDGEVLVKGPKGELRQRILSDVVEVRLADGKVIVDRKGDAKPHRSAHGLTRTLIANMVEGVSKGFRKSLEISGVGYRAAKSGERLNLSLGFSHPVAFDGAQGRRALGRGTEQDPRRGHRQAGRRPSGRGHSAAAQTRAVQGQRHSI